MLSKPIRNHESNWRSQHEIAVELFWQNENGLKNCPGILHMQEIPGQEEAKELCVIYVPAKEDSEKVSRGHIQPFKCEMFEGTDLV